MHKIEITSLNLKNYQQFLIDFSPIAHLLNFNTPEEILYIKDYCIRNLKKYNQIQIQEQQNKSIINQHRKKWYNTQFKAFENNTSGTTGPSFKYLIWKDIYNNIEGSSHYKAVANENGINECRNVLHLHKSQIIDGTDLIKTSQTNNPILSYGFGTQTTVHQVLINSLFIEDNQKYHEQLLKYISNHEFDIISTDFTGIGNLVSIIKKLNYKKKIAKLVCNTNSKPNLKALEYLTKNGLIDSFSDHMRCWDGGATFMTCRYKTYHLLDGLAWAYSSNNKLISYDYYSLPSVFYDYWNGDEAEISNDYQQCKCGRYYRPFKFLNGRIKQVAYHDNETIFKSFERINQKVKRAEVIDKLIRIQTTEVIDLETKRIIRSELPNMMIQFIVEND